MSFNPDFLSSLLGRRRGLLPGAATTPAPVPAPASKPLLPSITTSFFSPSTSTSTSTSSFTVGSTQGLFGSVISFFFYLSLIAFFIFIILVFVHFTIKPIFKFDINDKGLINVAPQGDGELVWKNSLADADQEAKFKNPLSCNYTISMDLFVKNQLAMSSTPRVLLYRANEKVDFETDKQPSDLFSLYSDTNLLVYLDSAKNDLNIVAVTLNSELALQPEGIPAIPNIPLETPFRITITFQPSIMEVYMNGDLQATRVFVGRPNETVGSFFGPSEFVRKSARIGNLQYWPRILAPSEIKSMGPTLPGPDFFVVKV